MGLFDEIKDKLTTSDAERAEQAQAAANKAEEEAKAAQAQADELAKKAGLPTEAQQSAQQTAEQASHSADEHASAPATPAAPAAPAVETAPAAKAPTVVPAAAHAPAAAPKAAAPAEKPLRTHTVVSGDTLSAIGHKYGVNWHKIAELNHVKNPDLIYPGQVFKIPND